MEFDALKDTVDNLKEKLILNNQYLFILPHL